MHISRKSRGFLHKQISHIRIAALLGPVLFVFLLVSQTSQTASGAFIISYSNVVENQTLSGVYKVVVVASDISQVSNIKLYIDGVFLKTETYSPYEFSIATTNYADGNRVLKAVATDKSGNTNAAQVTVSVLFDNIADSDPPASSTIIIMQDTTKSSGWGIYSTRPVMAEYVSSSSVLVGKNIDSITVNLKKSSSSATGTAQIGIINSNLSIKKLFATLSISTLTTASTPYEFKLPAGETYLIQAGDRIGVKYTGGTSSSNYLAIMRDTDKSGPFDGTKTHLTYYTTSWAMSGSTLNHDLTMTLKYSGAAADTTPPTITAPAAIITEATGQLTLVSLGSATASDLVDSTPVVTNDAPSGGFPVGTTTVTWTATDDSGNSNTATQSITISDTTAPTLTAPAAITAEATGALTSVSLGSPTVSDTADPSLSVTNDAPSGGFPVGATTVTWTATDDSGNSVTATQTVTITDTTPPTVTASPGGGNYNSAQLVTLASNEAGTTVYYTLDGTSPTTSSFEYSSAISISTTTTVTFFGVDAASNFGSIVAETYTVDTTAPTVTAFPQGGTYGSIQSVTLTSVEDGTIIYYTTNGVDPTDSSAVYSSPIELSTSIVLKFFGKDASGNSGDVQSETYSISLPDTTPPSVIASPSGGVFGPSGVSVTLGADEQAVIIYYTTNDSDPTETSDQYSDTPILISTTTNLKFFGKDISGNSGSIVTETYNIDSTAPVVAIIYPSNGTTISGTIIGEATASDISGIDNVAGFLDSSPLNTDYNTPYELAIDTTNYSNGWHKFKVVAMDSSGNKASSEISVNINNVIDPIPAPGYDYEVVITDNGWSPSSLNVTIDAGKKVGFVNRGTFDHNIASGFHGGLDANHGVIFDIDLAPGQTAIIDLVSHPLMYSQYGNTIPVHCHFHGPTNESTVLNILNPPSPTATKIMRPVWLPFANIQGQLDAYKPVLQDYDWPRLRMVHSSNSIPADDLAAFMSLEGYKVLSVTTLEKVKAHTTWAKSQGFAGVEYNIEGAFDAGDTSAQIQEAASVVHAAGLKFVSTPTKAILADSWETIADVADMVHIQAQTLQANPDEFDAFVGDWVHKLKARNPNIIVTVQTGTGQPTAPGMTMLETFQYVTDLVIVDPDAVDGVSVWFGAGEEGLMESYFKWYHEKYRMGVPTPTPTPTDQLPTASVSHAPSSPTSSQSVTFTATATDDKGLTNIQIFVDGASIGSCSVAGLSDSCMKTAGPYPEGTAHSYHSITTDNKPQTNQSSTESFTVQGIPAPIPPSGLPSAQSVHSSSEFAAPASVDTFVMYMANEFHEGPGQWKMLSGTNEFFIPQNLTIHSGTKVSFHNADSMWSAPHDYQITIKNSAGAVVHTTETITYPDDTNAHANSQPVTLPPGTYTLGYVAVQGSLKAPAFNDETQSITVLSTPKDANANLIVGGFYATTNKAANMSNGDNEPRLGWLEYYQTEFPARGLDIESTQSFVYYSSDENGHASISPCAYDQSAGSQSCVFPGEDGAAWHDNKSGHHTLILWKSKPGVTLQQVWDALDALTTQNVYV